MTSKYEDEESEDDQKPLIIRAKDTVLLPARIAVSKPARRAYLTTILIGVTSTLLFGLAIAAYLLFYWSYIPYIGFERPVHLQFDDVYAVDATRAPHPYPYGIANLGTDIVSAQQYDIDVELRLPRTRNNRAAGNFMLELTLLAPEEKDGIGKGILETVKDGLGTQQGVLEPMAKALARSRRVAMVTYRAEITEWVYRFMELHWYLLGWRHEAETLEVGMFETVEFQKGWRNVPASLKLEVQSRERLQLYGAKVVFRARLKGIRWLMYNYKITSFFVFVGGFWATEMLFAGLAWGAIALLFSAPEQDVKAEELREVADHVKEEREEDDGKFELSDTERTFPTTTGQQKLRYQSPTVKQEAREDDVLVPELSTKATEADDEDEEGDFVLDSGLGTSMESSTSRRDSVRKRRGRLSSREER